MCSESTVEAGKNDVFTNTRGRRLGMFPMVDDIHHQEKFAYTTDIINHQQITNVNGDLSRKWYDWDVKRGN